ncbi:MAG: hypothetical protein CM15mP106_0100 [Candidatus Neomarinimicrobiota bacterium]|nr:MAG: hypothetical protein CM15mP106_0100 [Candidatus Neomarinimicrobiota bacterium]
MLFDISLYRLKRFKGGLFLIIYDKWPFKYRLLGIYSDYTVCQLHDLIFSNHDYITFIVM